MMAYPVVHGPFLLPCSYPSPSTTRPSPERSDRRPPPAATPPAMVKMRNSFHASGVLPASGDPVGPHVIILLPTMREAHERSTDCTIKASTSRAVLSSHGGAVLAIVGGRRRCGGSLRGRSSRRLRPPSPQITGAGSDGEDGVQQSPAFTSRRLHRHAGEFPGRGLDGVAGSDLLSECLVLSPTALRSILCWERTGSREKGQLSSVSELLSSLLSV